jgi:hypothetical protein
MMLNMMNADETLRVSIFNVFVTLKLAKLHSQLHKPTEAFIMLFLVSVFAQLIF